MLMMLAFGVHGHGVGPADAHAFGVEWLWGVGAADAHDAGFWCGIVMGCWLFVRNGHGVGAADAHDAGFWCGMAIG